MLYIPVAELLPRHVFKQKAKKKVSCSSFFLLQYKGRTSVGFQLILLLKSFVKSVITLHLMLSYILVYFHQYVINNLSTKNIYLVLYRYSTGRPEIILFSLHLHLFYILSSNSVQETPESYVKIFFLKQNLNHQSKLPCIQA